MTRPKGDGEKLEAGSRSGIQVIARAASVLRALEDESEGLSLGEIASRIDLPRSTVQRIVAALAEEQFLIAATPRSRVRLGPALIRLASATKLELNQLVRPHMEELSRQVGETVDLSVIQGRAAVFVDQIPGSHRLRAVSAIGDRFPLHATACGKALLAALPDQKVEHLLDSELERFTSHTIVDRDDLLDELAEIRKSGLAFDREEHTEGICAVGVSFIDPLGRVYALSLPTPTARFSRSQKSLTRALESSRNAITAMLGAANQD